MLNSSGIYGNSYVTRPPTIANNSASWTGSKSTRGLVPTAKVPTYLNRVRQGVRDTKPGLLPTPDIPPMRPGQAIHEFSLAEGAVSRRTNGYGTSTPYEDVYATPYASHESVEYHRTRSMTSMGNSVYSECAIDTPSSVGTTMPPPSTEKGQFFNYPRTGDRLNDDELIGSLLTLLIESEKTQQNSVSQSQQQTINADLMASIAGFFLPSSNLDNDTQ